MRRGCLGRGSSLLRTYRAFLLLSDFVGFSEDDRVDLRKVYIQFFLRHTIRRVLWLVFVIFILLALDANRLVLTLFLSLIKRLIFIKLE